MITGNYIFVGHSKGEYEGTKYNKVKLSDGIRILALKNSTGQDDFSTFVPEKTQVECGFKITSNKETATVELISIKAVKAS